MFSHAWQVDYLVANLPFATCAWAQNLDYCVMEYIDHCSWLQESKMIVTLNLLTYAFVSANSLQSKFKVTIIFYCVALKLKFRKYPSMHTNYIISHSTILQYNHNIWYGSYAEKKYWTRKTMISTGLPYLQFSMNSRGFSPARLTWPAYDGGRKRENSSAWKHRIIVAFTCRRSVEFGRYVTWLWMANCVSVMTKNATFV